MSVESAESRVRDAYRHAIATHDGEDELRAAIVALVAELAPEKLPPEQVIVRLKVAMRDPLDFALDRRRTPPKPRLAELVVRWCIEAYYQRNAAPTS